ncbi:hypothetical protein HYS96_00420 [Candidatus Daviesbacteria bacterium]|nr:hypothetical protein [Candidatus Daviesbacteria bacterium]
MVYIKKLVFAPLFLIVFAFLIYQSAPILKSYEAIFALSTTVLINLILISSLICLSSLSFVIFATFANNWKFSLPIAISASFMPIILINQLAGLILSVGFLVSFLITLVILDSSLKKYLDFQPASILGPPIKQLAGLLIISISLTYFVSVNTIIQQQGFQIPDSLIDTALKFSAPTTPNSPDLPQLSIPPDQLELLKQSGLDPSILDNLNSPKTQNTPNDLLKQTVKDQLQGLIKPYQAFVPAILAVLLFLTLQSLTSILNLLTYPLLWLTFFILEKSGFVKFVTEQRPVKKLMV